MVLLKKTNSFILKTVDNLDQITMRKGSCLVDKYVIIIIFRFIIVVVMIIIIIAYP